MSTSIFGPPPRHLTKFRARQRTLWRLKFGTTLDRSLSIPTSRFSTPVFVAIAATTSLVVGGGIGLGATALGRSVHHRSAAHASKECARIAATSGLSVIAAMAAMTVVVLTTLLTA